MELRSSWAPKRMCMYECRCFLQVGRTSAEQWNIALVKIFKVYYNANTTHISDLECLRHKIWIHGWLGTPTQRRNNNWQELERPVGLRIKCQILECCVLCEGRCEYLSGRLR